MTFDPFTPATLLAVLPEILLVALAALVMGLDLLWPENRKRALGLFAAGGLGLILVLTLIFARPSAEQALIFGGMLRDDWASYVFRMLFIFSGMIVALISLDSPGVSGKGEYYAILIAA